jgi:WD40 repeat protein
MPIKGHQGIILFLLVLACAILIALHHGPKKSLPQSRPVIAGENSLRDLYGDPLPRGALARFGSTYLKTDFQKIAFRGDGREFYSWEHRGRLSVHDVTTGKVLRSFLLPDPPASEVQFSADGRFITLGVDLLDVNPAAKALNIWETSSGQLRCTIVPTDASAFVSWDALLPDGRTLFTCDIESGIIRIWDVETGASRVIRNMSGNVDFVAAKDRQRLFVNAHGKAICVNVADGGVLWQADPVKSHWLKLAPDGQAILAVCDKQHLILDPDSGKIRPMLQAPPQTTSWPDWGADSRTVVISDWNKKVVRLYDIVSGKERQQIPGDWMPGAIAPNGDTIITRYNGLMGWEVRNAQPLYPTTRGRGHTEEVVDLACSPDGNVLVSLDGEGNTFQWDTRTSKLTRNLPVKECVSLAFTSDGTRLLLGKKKSNLDIYDPSTGQVLENRHLDSAFFGGMKSMVITDDDGLVLNRPLVQIGARGWSSGPGSETVAWDTKTGKRLWQRKAEGTLGLTGISPDGRFGVAWDMSLQDIETGKVLGSLNKRSDRIQTANHATVFSKDSSLIATYASYASKSFGADDWEDGSIEVWDRATCRLLRQFRVALPGSFVFSNSGKFLAALRDTELWVWDMSSGKQVLHRESGDGATWCGVGLLFLPDDRALLMPTEDGSILLWDIPGNK